VYNSPIKLILIVSLSIFFCEILVMFILLFFPFIDRHHAWTESIIDAILLVIFLLPVIYIFFLNPLVLNILNRRAAKKLV